MLGNFVEYEDNSSPGSRRRSNVSFYLEGSAGRDEDQVSPFDNRSTADSPHVRTIDDTFTAWQDSFRRADSRASLFGYAGGSNFRTLDGMTDADSDTSSTYSDRQQQFSRPQSAFSRPHGSAKVTWERHISTSEVKRSLSDSNLQSQENEKPIDKEVESFLDNNNNKEQSSINVNIDDKMDYKPTNQETPKALVAADEEEITQTPRDKNPAEIKTTDTDNVNENLLIQPQIIQEENGERNNTKNTITAQPGTDKDSNPTHFENTAEGDTEKKDNSCAEGLMDPREKSKQSTTSLSDISSEVSIPIIISDESSEITSVGLSITNDEKSSNHEIQDNEIGSSAVINELEMKSKIDNHLSTYERKLTENQSKHENEIHTENEIEKANEINMGEENADGNREISEITERALAEKREINVLKSEEKGKQEIGQMKDSIAAGSHLNVEGEDEPDLEFNMETNSEYTLKGIRGILRRRSSVAATSVGFDFDQSDITDDDYDEGEDKPYDLATKEGLDEFKEFLLGTVAEKYLRLWIDIECLRHDKEKNV